MTLERFRECADSYGAERRRWPSGEHALYDKYARAPEGMAILAAAERTDRFLDALEIDAPREGFAQGVLAQAGGRAARRSRGLWLGAAAFAASAVFGFIVGFAQVPDDPGADALAQLLLGPANGREIGL
jgi:hypothetical protein